MILSGSKMTRFWQCPASAVLPQCEETDVSAGTGGTMSPMAKGKMVHAFLERWLNMGRESALELVADPDIRDLCAGINHDDVPWLRDRESTTVHPDCRYYAEVAFAYNVKTGEVRHLGNGLDRDYSGVHEDEIPITVDFVGVFSDHIHVGDYKTGIGAEGYTAKVDDNKQVLLGALCACRFYRRSCARVSINHVHDNGRVSDESKLIDSLDLDSFAETLKHKWEEAKKLEAEVRAGKVPNVHRGPWCRYCLAANQCPAVVSLVRAVSADPNAVADEALAMLANGEVEPAMATKAYQRYRELKSAVDRVGKALVGYSQKACIDLGNGKVYGPHVTKRKEIDAEKARGLLSELYSKEVAEAACTFETSAAAIERGVKLAWEEAKRQGLKITKKSMVDSVMEELNKQGAIQTKEVVKVEEY